MMAGALSGNAVCIAAEREIVFDLLMIIAPSVGF